jgi:hypothetical protein
VEGEVDRLDPAPAVAHDASFRGFGFRLADRAVSIDIDGVEELKEQLISLGMVTDGAAAEGYG